ncbi:amidohydrolase [Aquabacter sp. CN5-332]|uniref:amidohydrolase n=1 Tax=Aquabacter sp. CN5-332 TaxID=3156608 RepID=UPI0032B59625
MTDPVLAEIDTFVPELVAIRRDIHGHPETGFEEVRTSALVAKTLRSYGLEVTDGIAETGVIATLKGSRPGQRAIALRADMDALNIAEKTGAPYASSIPGKMHACGHDGHTAMLLGAARYLSRHPDFGGTVHFIFQPAEEGLGGARRMIEEKVLERFPFDAIYGLHNKPGIPVGRFATRVGPMLAAADSWVVTFKGTGGHGGSGAHFATDPTIPLAHFTLALQAIIGRNVPALETAVISIGHISAGLPGAYNIIPSEIRVEGTARSYLPAIRDLLERRIGEVANAHAAASGCTAVYDYDRRYPPLINHPEAVAQAIAAAQAVVGEAAVDGNTTPITAGEDLAFFLERRPGVHMMIGNGISADGKFHNLHTPLYNFNDEIIPLGVRYWVSVVEKELGGKDAVVQAA